MDEKSSHFRSIQRRTTQGKEQFMKKRIGFIGAGNMGEAMIGALIGAGIFPPDAVVISDANKKRTAALTRTYGVSAADDNFQLFMDADIVVLAVKPQMMSEVLSEIAGRPDYANPDRTLVISIAAGTPIRKIADLLHEPLDAAARKRMPVIRVMPNTPALALAGMSGMSPNADADASDIDIARQILSAMGEVREFPESLLDAVTGVSGSGPAYVFYLIEAMIEGGVRSGLDREDAAALTLQTVKGAVRLMEERGEDPAELRRKVTSPGGTTEAALRVLESAGVKDRIAEAVTAAARRSKELSG
jgi:pyrroline-5-carboxylate reductase